MPIYDYNDIRNDDWYARLVRGVRERTSAGVRRAGADPNDPYYKAKEAEGLGDLASARQDAFRRAFAAARQRQAMLGAGMREREAGKQRTITAAMQRDYRPDVGLGTMPDGGGAGLGAAAPEPILMSPQQPPEAYPRPTGAPRVQTSAAPAGVYTQRGWAAGGFSANKPAPAPPVSAGYDPTVFQNKAVTNQKKLLEDMIYKTAESLYKQRAHTPGTIGSTGGGPMDYYAQALKLVTGR